MKNVTMPRKAKKKLPNDFETAMQDLETLVSQMENGDMTLEDSLTAFEEGVQLTRICQTALSNVEQRVTELSPEGKEIVFDRDTE